MSQRLLPFVVLLLLVACAKDPGAVDGGRGGDAGASDAGHADAGTDGSTIGDVCLTSAECAQGVCDRRLRECVVCRANVDCAEGSICMSGSCVAQTACSGDRNCTDIGLVCDRENGRCVGCNRPGDCSGDDACLGHSCVPAEACETTSTCVEPLVCADEPLGREGTPRLCLECADAGDCSFGEDCLNGYCVDVCGERTCGAVGDALCGQCGDGAVCGVDQRYCVRVSEERADSPLKTDEGWVAWQNYGSLRDNVGRVSRVNFDGSRSELFVGRSMGERLPPFIFSPVAVRGDEVVLTTLRYTGDSVVSGEIRLGAISSNALADIVEPSGLLPQQQAYGLAANASTIFAYIWDLEGAAGGVFELFLDGREPRLILPVDVAGPMIAVDGGVVISDGTDVLLVPLEGPPEILVDLEPQTTTIDGMTELFGGTSLRMVRRGVLYYVVESPSDAGEAFRVPLGGGAPVEDIPFVVDVTEEAMYTFDRSRRTLLRTAHNGGLQEELHLPPVQGFLPRKFSIIERGSSIHVLSDEMLYMFSPGRR